MISELILFHLIASSKHSSTIDATRVTDGKTVTLKKVNRTEHPFEADIALYLSSPELASDPRNHCVPILEILTKSDEPLFQILVMPRLRAYGDPEFDTCGEVLESFRQLIEVWVMLYTVYLVLNFWEGTAIHAQIECGPPVSMPGLSSDLTPEIHFIAIAQL